MRKQRRSAGETGSALPPNKNQILFERNLKCDSLSNRICRTANALKPRFRGIEAGQRNGTDAPYSPLMEGEADEGNSQSNPTNGDSGRGFALYRDHRQAGDLQSDGKSKARGCKGHGPPDGTPRPAASDGTALYGSIS